MKRCLIAHVALIGVGLFVANCPAQLSTTPTVKIRFEINSRYLEKDNPGFANSKAAIQESLAESTARKIREKHEFRFLNWRGDSEPLNSSEIELVVKVFDKPAPDSNFGHVQLRYHAVDERRLLRLNEFIAQEPDTIRGGNKHLNDVYVKEIPDYGPRARSTKIQSLINIHFDSAKFRRTFNEHFLQSVLLADQVRMNEQNILLPLDFENLGAEPTDTIFKIKYKSQFPDNASHNGRLELILESGSSTSDSCWWPSGRVWNATGELVTQCRIKPKTFKYSFPETKPEQIKSTIEQATSIEVFMKHFVPEVRPIIPGTTIDG